MYSDSLSSQLKRAVRGKDTVEVERLLKSGADPNLRTQLTYRDFGSYILHEAYTADIVELLLKYGAQVDKKNRYRETALHCAVTLSRGKLVVRKLLEHGADVNILNRRGQTPLYQAVRKYHDDWDVVVELLWYRAEITRSGSLNHAIRYRQKYALLLIRMTILTHYNEDYQRIVDLAAFEDCESYAVLSSYLNDCIQEVTRMKNLFIDGVNVCELVNMESSMRKISRFLSIQKIDSEFQAYKKMLMSLREIFLQNRIEARRKLEEQNIQAAPGTLLAIHVIAEYLSYDDLMNLVAAFESDDDDEDAARLKAKMSDGEGIPKRMKS